MVNQSASSCGEIGVGLFCAFGSSGRPVHPGRPGAPLLSSEWERSSNCPSSITEGGSTHRRTSAQESEVFDETSSSFIIYDDVISNILDLFHLLGYAKNRE